MATYSILSDNINVSIGFQALLQIHIGTLYAGLKNTSTNSITNNITSTTLPTISFNALNNWCMCYLEQLDNTAAYIYANLSENNTNTERTCSFKLKYNNTESTNVCKITQLSNDYIKGIIFKSNYSFTPYNITTLYGFNNSLKCGLLEYNNHNSGNRILCTFNIIKEFDTLSNGTYSDIVSTTYNYMYKKEFKLEYEIKSGLYTIIYDIISVTGGSNITQDTINLWISNYINLYNTITTNFTCARHVITLHELVNSYLVSTNISSDYYTRIGTIVIYSGQIKSNLRDYITYIPFGVYAKKNTGNSYTMMIISVYPINMYSRYNLDNVDYTENVTLDDWLHPENELWEDFGVDIWSQY